MTIKVLRSGPTLFLAIVYDSDGTHREHHHLSPKQYQKLEQMFPESLSFLKTKTRGKAVDVDDPDNKVIDFLHLLVSGAI